MNQTQGVFRCARALSITLLLLFMAGSTLAQNLTVTQTDTSGRPDTATQDPIDGGTTISGATAVPFKTTDQGQESPPITFQLTNNLQVQRTYVLYMYALDDGDVGAPQELSLIHI